jgi:hypothetical protein
VRYKAEEQIEVVFAKYPVVAQPLIASQCAFLILASNTNENLTEKSRNLKVVGVAPTTVASTTQAPIKIPLVLHRPFCDAES